MVVVVPDASVILKWVLPPDNESHSENALAVREQYQAGTIDLVVPALWRFEIGNTLSRRYPEDAPEDLLDLEAMTMREPELSRQWLEHACQLVRESAVTFYDAAYHALAVVESGTFITADERYLRAIGRSNSLCHLAEWSL